MKRLIGFYICLITWAVLFFTLITGCVKRDDISNSNIGADVTGGESEYMSQVLGHYNGTPITRGDVSYIVSSDDVNTSWIDLEKRAILRHAYSLAVDDLLKDVELTETEIENQISLMKTQADAEGWVNWDMYVTINYGTEEALREALVTNMKQGKYMESLGATVEYTEQDVIDFYNENKSNYDNASLDVIFFDGEESYNKGIELYNSGMTLEAIAEEMDLEVYPSRYVYLESDLEWNVPLTTCRVGDTVYTLNSEDDITLLIGRIVTINVGYDNEEMKEQIEKDYVLTRGSILANENLIEFLRTVEFEVLGEKIELYSDDMNLDLTGVAHEDDENLYNEIENLSSDNVEGAEE